MLFICYTVHKIETKFSNFEDGDKSVTKATMIILKYIGRYLKDYFMFSFV